MDAMWRQILTLEFKLQSNQEEISPERTALLRLQHTASEGVSLWSFSADAGKEWIVTAEGYLRLCVASIILFKLH